MSPIRIAAAALIVGALVLFLAIDGGAFFWVLLLLGTLLVLVDNARGGNPA